MERSLFESYCTVQRWRVAVLAALLALSPVAHGQIQPVNWTHLSSATGDLPVPPVSNGQSGLKVVDLDKNGQLDYVLTLWQAAQTVVWYRHIGENFEPYVIDTQTPNLSHGEGFKDIDGDGDIDLLIGDASSGDRMYWWENPYPNYDPNVPWVRRLVRDGGGLFYHDNIWGDFDGDGQDELISWNQYSGLLLLFEIPADPRNSGPWPVTTIFSYGGPALQYRGAEAIDINLDGKVDFVGGGGWFEHAGGVNFIYHSIDPAMKYSQIKAGQFIPGGRPEVVCVAELESGPLRFYQWNGSQWVGKDLLDVPESHTLQVGDVNGDGHLDIVTGQIGQTIVSGPTNPNATLWVLYGDGAGNFTQQILFAGQGDLEGQLADIDNDGDLDLLAKPFRHNSPRMDIHINEGFGPIVESTDSVPPVILSVQATQPGWVTILFSEPLNQSSAQVPAHYAIDRGVSVTAAQLDVNQRTVRLTTTPLSPGIVYTLGVSNLRDKASPANQIPPGSTRSFRFETLPSQDLALWFKADEGTVVSGQKLSQWNDQSGNNRHGTQSASSRQPELKQQVINGTLPAIQFDGMNDFLEFPLPVNGLGGLSLFLVAADRQNQNGGSSQAEQAALFWNETAFWGTIYLSPFQSRVNLRFGTTQAGNQVVYQRPGSAGSAFTLTTAVKSGTTDTLFVNGTQVLSQGGKLPTIAGCRDTGNVARGFNDNTFFGGDIAEVLVYRRALTAGERESVGNYLMAKYQLGPARAPVIVQSPASLTVAGPGSAGFIVVATGTGPLSYQWRRNGVPISGATQSSYTLTPTSGTTDNGAQFSVVVSNAAGSITSAAANLTVTQGLPLVLMQPVGVTVAQPNAATFSVQASGTGPLSYQWQRGGVNISGATGSSYTLNPTSVAADNGAQFRVLVSNTAGSVTSSAATLNVIPRGSRVTSGLVALYGFSEGTGTTVNDISGVGTPLDLTLLDPARIQWLPGGGVRFNTAGSAIRSPNAASKIHNALAASGKVSFEAWLTSSDLGQFGPARIATWSEGTASSQMNLHVGQGGSSSGGDIVSFRLRTSTTPFSWLQAGGVFAGTLTPRHLVVTFDGTAQRVYVDGVLQGPGQPVTGNFSNWTASYPFVLGNEATLDRSWLGSLFLVAVYDRALSLSEVQQNFAGGLQAGSPLPDITVQPSNRTVVAPSSALFSVTASSSAPLSYQWRRGDVNMAGATGTSYTLNPTTAGDNGAQFRVVVSNASGSVTSLVATLTVNAPAQPPSIVTSPANVTAFQPAAAVFSVVASGTAPLSYQWRRGGVNIGGATGSSYTLNPTSTADNGAQFDVVISNASGSLTSEVATLTVNESSLRVTGGLVVLYDFAEGSGTTVHDVSGVGSPFNLNILDPIRIQWLSGGGVRFNSSGSAIRSPNAASKIHNALVASGKVSFEAWLTSSDLGQFGPARIATWSEGTASSQMNLHVGQGGGDSGGDSVSFRLRTSTTPFSWLQAGGVFTGNVTPRHLVVTFDGTAQRVYVDGVLQGPAQPVTGNFSNWTASYPFVLGNEATLDRSWLGSLFLVAVYDRALSLSEVQQNFAGGLQAGPPLPEITAQPNNRTVVAPGSAPFSVTASSSAPLSYQWRRGGVDIGGATGSSYTLNPTTVADNGAQFDVVVSNASGSVTSGVATLTVNSAAQPPSIVTPPANVTVSQPAAAMFSVVASGTAPLTYQWRRGGVNIGGATGSSYTLNPTTLADNGAQFDVVLSNASGSVTSGVATLTVEDQLPSAGLALWLRADMGPVLDGSSISMWRDQSGNNRHAAQAVGSSQPRLSPAALNGFPVARFDGINDFLTFLLPLNGQGGLTMFLVAANTANQTGGATQAEAAALFWNESAFWGVTYLTPFQSRVNVRFGTTQSGNMPTYLRPASIGSQFSLSTAVKDGLTDSLYVNHILVLSETGKFTTMAGGQDTGNLGRGFNNNTYFAGEIAEVLVYDRALSAPQRQAVEQYLDAKYGLTIPVPPQITTQPGNVTSAAPTAAMFNVVASGAAPLTYQWRRNGANIGGATGSSYTLNPTTLADNGAQFDVVVSNSGGSVTSVAATLTVNSAAQPPSIVTSPANVTVVQPVAAMFSVVATGTAPLTYQWRRNGVNISGATGSSFTLNPTTLGDNGAQFDVVVGNVTGSATSGGATLTVNSPAQPPSIVTPPANVTVSQPAAAMFSVVASGTAPLTYQWRRNGANIGGATGSSYTLNPTAVADNGAQFDVVVSNASGSVTSGAAALTVEDQLPSAGLALWLRADMGPVLDGSSISMWRDQSGNNRHAAQSVVSSQPRLSLAALNGLPVARFDGINDFLTFLLPLNGQEGLTMFLVAANTANQTGGATQGAEAALFWNETQFWGVTYLTPFQSRVNVRFGTTQSGNMPVFLRPAAIESQFSLTTAVKNGATDSLYVNRSLVLSETGKFTTMAGGQDTGNLGRGFNNNSYFAGEIAEVLIYDRALTTLQQQTVEQYLDVKYGLSIPANIPVPPQITAQPADVMVNQPAGTTFSVSATGTAPLFYQWRRNGSNIAGATGSSFTLNSTSAGADNGAQFSVLVSNALGVVTSQTATLSVAGLGAVPSGGLALWLRADAGIVSGGSGIIQWTDQSGNNRHAAQGSAGSQPALAVDGTSGSPVVRFDGVDDYLSFGMPVNGLTAVSIFIVTSSTLNNSAFGPEKAALFWNETDSWGTLYLSPYQETVNLRFGTTQVGNSLAYTRPGSVGSGLTLTTAIKNGATESLFVDGTLVSSQGGKFTTIAGCLDTADVGRGFNNNTFFAGDVAEILVYNRAVSAAERLSVEQYLAAKYNSPLTVPECPPGLVSYWRLNETSGIVFRDSVGQNHASCVSAVCPGTGVGRVSGGLSFNETQNSRVSAPGHASMNFGAQESFTLECWVRTEVLGVVAYFGRIEVPSLMEFSLGQNVNGQPSFYLRDNLNGFINDLIDPNLPPLTPTWRHVVGVRDKSAEQARLYVDGVLVNTRNTAGVFGGDFASSNATLNIGWIDLAHGYQLGGSVDEVALYRRALTPTEIMDHYTMGLLGLPLCSE